MATVEKIRKDIEKTKEKISAQQKRLRELEAQLTEEENLEIVRMVKAVRMDNKELTAFLKAYASGLITLPDGMMEAEAAALSTDAAGNRVYLEANDCNVITTRSGYGTYADTGCYCVLNRCNLDVQNMAAIVAGESGVTLKDCTAKCGSYVVLNHVVGGGPGEGIFTQVSSIAIEGGKY